MNKFLEFFKKLFLKRKKDLMLTESTASSNNKEQFKESLKIDNEELRIVDLQKDYKAGKILEKDIPKEDRQKLIELYNRQNRELEKEIKEKEKILNEKKKSLLK